MTYLFIVGLLVYGSTIQLSAAPNHRPSDDPMQPSLAYNETTRDYLVVWKHYNYPSCDLLGQIIKEDGTRKQAFLISSDAHSEFTPEAVFNPLRNEYLVVWANQTGKQIAIHGTLLDQTGQKRPPHHPRPDSSFIICNNSKLTSQPKAAFNTTHNTYLVCWTEGTTQATGSIPLLVTQRLDKDGTFLTNTHILPIQPEMTPLSVSLDQESASISFYPSYGKQVDEWFVMICPESLDPPIADIGGIRIRGSDGQPIGIWDTMQAYWKKL